MNVFLRFRERIAALSHPLLLEFEQLLTVIRTTFRAEHNDDGSHAAVTADSLTVTGAAAQGATTITPPASATQVAVRIINTTGVAARSVIVLNAYADETTGARVAGVGNYAADFAQGVTLQVRTAANALLDGLVVGPTGRVGVYADVALPEMTAPSGVANTGLLFCRDNGAGKTQLCVIFGSGAVQVVATEP